jgi:hypothetical protein
MVEKDIKEEKDIIRKILNEYSPQEALRHVEYFVSLGERLSGTRAEEKGIHYIKEVAESYGLTVELHEIDAFLSYGTKESKLELKEAPKMIPVGERTIECVGYAFSGSTPSNGIEGELIYMGSGTVEDFENTQIKGKIALINLGFHQKGLSPIELSRITEKHGAIGQIHINNYRHGKSCLFMSSANTHYGNPTEEDVDKMSKIPTISITFEDGEYIKDLLKLGKVRVWMKSEVWRGWGKVILPIAEIRGSSEPEKYVLVGVHFDGWWEGATDPATGCAFQLEMGRILSKYKKYFKRSIKFAWWPAHSTGAYSSSTWFVDNFWDDIQKNCISYFFADGQGLKGTQLYSSWHMAEFQKFYEPIIKEVTGKEDYYKIRPYKGGDMSSFFGIGVPSTGDFITYQPNELNEMGNRMGWWLHSPFDTLENVDMEVSRFPYQVYVTAILKLCNDSILPFEFVSVAEEFCDALQDLRDSSKEIINLDGLIEKVKRLKELADILKQWGFKFKGRNAPFRQTEDAFRIINRCLMKLSRILIPINYTAVGRYGQDTYSYRNLKPFPVMQDLVNRAQKMDSEAAAFKSLKTTLVREKNKVSDSIELAIEFIDYTIMELKNLK